MDVVLLLCVFILPCGLVVVLVCGAFLLCTFLRNDLSFCIFCILHSLLGSCWDRLGWTCIHFSNNLVLDLILVSVVCPFFVVCFIFVVCFCVFYIELLFVVVGLCLMAICLGWPVFVGFLGLFLLRGRIVVSRSGRGLLIISPLVFVRFAYLEWRCFLLDCLLSLPNCKVLLFALFLGRVFPVIHCDLVCNWSIGKRLKVSFLTSLNVSFSCSANASVVHFDISVWGILWWKMFVASCPKDR